MIRKVFLLTVLSALFGGISNVSSQDLKNYIEYDSNDFTDYDKRIENLRDFCLMNPAYHKYQSGDKTLKSFDGRSADAYDGGNGTPEDPIR